MIGGSAAFDPPYQLHRHKVEPACLLAWHSLGGNGPGPPRIHGGFRLVSLRLRVDLALAI